MNCARALGTMAAVLDIIPTTNREKLSRVDAGTAQFDYMLATLVFDLVKKNAMLHKALREFALQADPDITRQYVDDIRAIEELDQDYEALAHLTESQMLRSISETMADHMTLAEMVVRWDDEESAHMAGGQAS
jgi:hypothetical protein